VFARVCVCRHVSVVARVETERRGVEVGVGRARANWHAVLLVSAPMKCATPSQYGAVHHFTFVRRCFTTGDEQCALVESRRAGLSRYSAQWKRGHNSGEQGQLLTLRLLFCGPSLSCPSRPTWYAYLVRLVGLNCLGVALSRMSRWGRRDRGKLGSGRRCRRRLEFGTDPARRSGLLAACRRWCLSSEHRHDATILPRQLLGERGAFHRFR
jgi:hypothetical protein